MMDIEAFEDDLDELSSAEDFLSYFDVPFEPSVVHVNRLHILQRFHNYLGEIEAFPQDADGRYGLYKEKLQQAYADFVESDAVTEKVFRVFHMHEQQPVFVTLEGLPR